LEGDEAKLKVACSGSMPDNLAEGIAVLIEGRMDKGGVLQGEKVLTRCASKYESRQPHSSTNVASRPKAEDRR